MMYAQSDPGPCKHNYATISIILEISLTLRGIAPSLRTMKIDDAAARLGGGCRGDAPGNSEASACCVADEAARQAGAAGRGRS